jgi:hypothetical protein
MASTIIIMTVLVQCRPAEMQSTLERKVGRLLVELVLNFLSYLTLVGNRDFSKLFVCFSSSVINLLL